LPHLSQDAKDKPTAYSGKLPIFNGVTCRDKKYDLDFARKYAKSTSSRVITMRGWNLSMPSVVVFI